MRRNLIIGAMVLAWAWSLSVWGTVAAHAYAWAEPTTAYTLDHPIDPDRLVLATPGGRYQIQAGAGDCSWLASYRNVLAAWSDHVDVIALTPRDTAEAPCFVDNLGLVDQTPCFGYDVCDVSYETEG